MISIIVCSVNPILLDGLRLNIEATIGVPFELLAFDNREQQLGITTVYNRQAAKAKYDSICFIHEDVVIHTKNWGILLHNLLENKFIGLVGVSGGVYKSKYPGTWSTCSPSLYRTHTIQHFKNKQEAVITNINPDNLPFDKVSVIDGLFMATRKAVFDQYSFDDFLLKGFHGYDIDYSLQVGQQYEVVVSYELLLEHLSEGTLNEAWLRNSLLVHEKWKHQLPVQSRAIDSRLKKQSDYQSCRCVLGIALLVPGNKRMVLYYFSILMARYFSFNQFLYTKTVWRYLLNISKK